MHRGGAGRGEGIEEAHGLLHQALLQRNAARASHVEDFTYSGHVHGASLRDLANNARRSTRDGTDASERDHGHELLPERSLDIRRHVGLKARRNRSTRSLVLLSISPKRM